MVSYKKQNQQTKDTVETQFRHESVQEKSITVFVIIAVSILVTAAIIGIVLTNTGAKSATMTDQQSLHLAKSIESHIVENPSGEFPASLTHEMNLIDYVSMNKIKNATVATNNEKLPRYAKISVTEKKKTGGFEMCLTMDRKAVFYSSVTGNMTTVEKCY